MLTFNAAYALTDSQPLTRLKWKSLIPHGKAFTESAITHRVQLQHCKSESMVIKASFSVNMYH